MLNIYHLEHKGTEGYGEQFIKIINIVLIEGSGFACNGPQRGLYIDGVGLSSCVSNSAVGVLPLKGYGAYSNTAADVVHPSG